MTKLEDALARLAERVARRKDGKGALPPPSFVPPCGAKAPPQPPHKAKAKACNHVAKPRQYKDED